MNGLIIVNKETGYTSRDVVNILSKTLQTKKIGHTGTLDPIAEGVLVCVIGKCTKLCDILVNDEKEYVATMQLGVLTDTLDNTGKILKKDDTKFSKEEINNALNHFVGEYEQVVPEYSAVKINGKKLYEYARNNIDVELPKRLVSIKKIELIEINDNLVTFKVLVSKGTYIRSLIRDIGKFLGSYGTMTKLIRTKQGKFNILESYKLDDIKKGNYKYLTIKDIFKDYLIIDINEEMFKKVRNGQVFNNELNSEFVLFSYNDEIVAVYMINKKDKSKIKPLIMLNS